MAWLGVVGAAVIGGAATATAAVVVGGAIVGAAVGALYCAVTDQNILKGALYGAVGGAVVGYGATVAGVAGSTASGTAASATGSGTTSLTVAEGGGYALGSGEGIQLAGAGAGSLVDSGTTAAASSFWSSETVAAVGSIGSVAAKFIESGSTLSAEDQLKAQAEQNALDREQELLLARESNETTLKTAATSLEATKEKIASDEEIAAAQLEFDKDSWQSEFDESNWRYRNEWDEAEDDEEMQTLAVGEAAESVKENSKTVGLVENFRRRQSFEDPSWKSEATNAETDVDTTSEAADA